MTPLVPILALALPFSLALAVMALPVRAGRWLALAGPAGVAACGAALWGALPEKPVSLEMLPWAPSLGVRATLLIDRLGVFFLLLIGLVGLAVIQYARAYFGPKAPKSFWALMLVFQGAMSGLVLSDDLILFFLFWELTTVTSALLIGGDGTSAEARRGAIQAFLVTGFGGLCLLAGIVMTGLVAGTFELSELPRQRAALEGDARHFLPLALMLVGALAKSAQVPFHFWLPGAMAASTPVSAYLHSATMVQAGIVLVARLLPTFGGSPLWLPLLSTVGLATFVVAGWSALRSYDLKRLLAYSTAAYLGLVTAYYGYVGATGAHDDLALIANHALYKSALFLLVGWIEKVTGTRDLRTLTPERWVQHVPLGAALFALGVAAMAGAPLLLGFAAKEAFLAALLGAHAGAARWLAAAASTVASGLALGYALKFGNVFFGREEAPLERGYPRQQVSAWLVAVPALLLVPQLIGGAAPRALSAALEPGSQIPSGPAFWHHADALLALSLAGYLLGGVFFAFWQPLARARTLLSIQGLAEAGARATLRAAAWLGASALGGGHPRFLWVTAGAALAGSGALALGLAGAGWPRLAPGGEADIAWAPAALVALGVGGALRLRARESKLLSLGMVGFGVALFYALFRAPDLVLTQVLAESLSLVLVLLAFGRLPPLGPDRRSRGVKLGHAALAAAVGLGMAALAAGAAASRPSPTSGQAQLALALPEGGGKNAVNVILVDFRGADTLGEITVLAIAALGALVLLRRAGVAAPPPRTPSAVLPQAALALVPATLVFAGYLLLRGHDAPGGGFVAGLVVLLALVLERLSHPRGPGPEEARARALAGLGAGLLLGTAAASAAVVAGRPFFTHFASSAQLAGWKLLATTLLFDLGVFVVVAASAATFVTALREGEP